MAKFRVISQAESKKKEEKPVDLWLEQTGNDIALMYKLPDNVPRSLLYIDGDMNTACLFEGDCANLELRKL